MPVLTRAAAKRLGVETQEANSLALRAPVASMAEAVWSARAETDAYTRLARKSTVKPQVDHVLECQLAEASLATAFGASRARFGSMASSQVVELLRENYNDTFNLNVTSCKVNQSKKGPIVAALNRLQDGRLRAVPLEQLARQGKARWLVDEGVWRRIENEMVASYDRLSQRLDDSLTPCELLPAASDLVACTRDELHAVLCSMRVW
ncbi:MAG: hypothetical protein CMI16_07520 [Opitutaceae bacterium]|nr:hypothetical protein [Opitutaceae bacterium]